MHGYLHRYLHNYMSDYISNSAVMNCNNCSKLLTEYAKFELYHSLPGGVPNIEPLRTRADNWLLKKIMLGIQE